MLEFWQNGKKIEINAIYGKGKIGQTVIYGQEIDWGEKATPNTHPLMEYTAPSIFTIVDKQEEFIGYYILKDSHGKFIELPFECEGQYLYDAQEWISFIDLKQKEKNARKQRKIEQLEGNVALLKDILIKQGTHIITEEQAKELELKNEE